MKRNKGNGTSPPDALDVSRAELFALMLGGAGTAPAIPQRYPSASAWPLTFGQEGLWFLAELGAASGAYNLPLAFRITGSLDEAALAVAFTELVARHETLRTRFDMHQRRVVQKVDAAEPFALVVADAPADDAALRAAVRHEAQRPFDLAREHAFRAVLYRGDGDYVLLLTLHHIICDTHSIGVLLRDLTALYEAAVSGGDVALPPLEIQYADYALWQRGNVNAATINAELDFWKKQLAGYVPADLPLDRPRPELPTFSGGQLSCALPPAVTAALREIAQGEGATPFMLLVGVLQLLLSRWSGQRDIAIGTPIARRTYPQMEPLIGYFGNTVLIRAVLDERMTFRDLLATVKRSALDAYAHSEIPFERVVAAVQPQRDLSRQALFQVMAVLQSADVPPPPLPGIEVSPLAIERNGSKFDLSLEFFEQGNELVVRWEYATDLFLPETIARLSRQFVQLATEIAQSPGRVLSAYAPDAFAAPAARDWNDTQVAIDTSLLVHELFEQRAQATPDALAVVDDHGALTYAQLNARSNRFAHWLIAQGIGRDDVIGLVFERSCELGIALVGTLKAGAAYLPIDTEFPDARIAYLIDDARPKLIATSAALQARCAGIAGAARVCRVDGAGIDDASEENPSRHARATDLAYVMYTSGSTGKPKGVETEHAALLNRVLWMQDAYPIGADDRVLQKTPYTFDVSVWEFVWPLMMGARLVMAQPGGHRDAHYLRTTIDAQGITVLHFVPSMLAAFLSQSADLSCPSLRHVMCSGEALPGSVVQRFYAANASARLHNLYGPTEAAIDVTYFDCERGAQRAGVPIGRPIWNTQIHILDDALAPVADGAVGELYIGGAGLARGYRHRPDLTAERFIADPFSTETGARLYRTGDLVKRDVDGQIEYLGRGDHQVKIRGVRIEIGEIEAALLALPGVGEGAVVVRERANGKQLVACVSPAQGGAAPDTASLRDALRASLPEAFVPAAFETWAQLPVTANGKLDRTALTQGLGGQSLEPAPANAPVREDIEARLTRIWRDVLDVATVDPRAGFFDIGGDSILAVAVARRVAEEFAQPFHVTDLFKHATVRAIGEALAAKMTPRSAPAPVRRPAPAIASEHAANKPAASPSIDSNSVAVIGMSCHFPGAPDVATLWDNLAAGRESIEFLSTQDGLDAGIPAALLDHPNYVAARSTIAGKASFDAAFFKVTPRDAQLMDPQLRHLLEHSWRAVEDAGYRPSQIADSAVFMSAASSFYHMPAFDEASQVLDRPDEYVAFVWAQPGTLPTTISHKLGLHGASLFVHSNCSSSLTALASAHRHILAGESKHALVGAATLFAYSSLGYLHQPGMHFSSDGHLRAFDAAADGMITGEGVAVLLLKNAADAIADGDHVYALLRGIALNNDGADKAGFYAPSAKGQADVIERALRATGVDPASIGYVEAHGTGTRLGDPIEFGALTDAYRRHTDRRGFCGLGSIKSNFGHLDTAAGLAGCLKVILSLAHARIPPTLHYTSPNPAIDLDTSPFHIVRTLSEWPAGDTPRRAAVSSFGIGGTNAHAIFEEWAPPAVADNGNVCLLPLSARSEERLRVYAGKLAAFLSGDAAPSLDSVAFTLQLGREPMRHRLALSAASTGEAAAKLRRYADGESSIDGLYHGEAGSREHGDSALLVDEDFQQTIDTWIDKARYAKLLELWVRGFAFDWARLHRGARLRRVSLPTYPFARQDYWLESSRREARANEAAAPVDTVAPRRAEALAAQEHWVRVADVETRRMQPGRVLCVAADEDAAQQMLDEWRRRGDRVDAVALWPGDGRVVRGDSGSYRAALSDVARDGAIDAVVCATSLRASANDAGWRDVLDLVQGLFAAGLTPARVLIGATYDDAHSRCHAESWIGLARSVHVLVPQVATAVLLQQGAADLRQWAQRAWAALRAESLRDARYDGEGRHELRVEECALAAGDSGLRAGGVYWITGGAGGLGAAIAQHLLQRYGAKVILSGRREPDASQNQQWQTWTSNGGELLYVAADVTDAAAMRAAVDQATVRFGAIDGVIHAAGVADAATLAQKSADGFAAVLAPKVRGTQVLDEALAGQPLRFICYFSSTAALLGDFGGGDYATGNRYQLAYAQHVDAAPGCRRIAIAWPLWEAGMTVGDAASTRLYLKASGQQALSDAQGVALWERALAQPGGHYVVMHGERARIERALGMSKPVVAPLAMPEPMADTARRPELRGLTLAQCVQWELREQIGALLKMGREDIRAQENLADYGFDSITLAQWAQTISRHYAIEITPAIFFSQTTLEKVASYLLAQHAAAMTAFYGAAQAPVAASRAPQRSAQRAEPITPAPITSAPIAPAPIETPTGIPEPIAIIGMSGRFAQARTIGEFWNRLVEGREAIAEIPPERFDWRDAFASGEIKSKWLGTLPGVAEFDALFFDTSPREALTMDPRQRLLLQESWNALEDAAYGQTQLTQQSIGVFVGVEQGEYLVLSGGQGTLTSNHDAILASRLSYFLDLRGPAMALNTSCSSGLVAAHQACLSLRAGECDAAIAAGVNLMLTPYAYAGMTQAGMLSEDGRCYAFDRRANGLVPGEAIVSVVLKRLSRAQADGDPIRAVIVASGINYDGHTNGITAPSGAAQARLIGEVYARAGIDARQIGYIVTHGTGTRLGDPVEINALQEVFGAHTSERGFCAITSAKSNVGHTFAASGLVNLVCAAQSLEHRQIPASLHCEEQSEYIDWEKSAFHVNRQTRPWQSDTPRLAALSAFGMSGTNVHMVLREAGTPVDATPAVTGSNWVLALSAKSPAALQQRIDDLRQLLDTQAWERPQLRAMSHTLLCGRQHFAHRCVVVAQDRGHALHLLERAAQGARGNGVFGGTVPHEFVGQKALERYGEDLLARLRDGDDAEALHALAELHCQGYALAWATLFADARPRRIALPTYPFVRDHYWIDASAALARLREVAPQRHPLLHENTSDLDGQRYTSRFDGDEFFLRDHVVTGERVLPGMAYLEMARAAIDAGGGAPPTADGVLTLRHVVWSRPLIVRDAAVDLHLDLYRQGDDEVGYEIYSATGDERVVHSQGGAAWLPQQPAPRIDIAALESRSAQRWSAADCYARLCAGGLDYGPSFRSLESIGIGTDESGVPYVVARLQLAEVARSGSERFVLHPAMLDGALHAVIGLTHSAQGDEPGADRPLVPYSVDAVRIHAGTGAVCRAVLRATTTTAQLPMLQVQLCDADGNVAVVLENLSARPAARSEAAERTIHFGREWRDAPSDETIAVDAREQRHVFLLQPDDGDAAFHDAFAAALAAADGVHAQRLDARGTIAERYARYGWSVVERLQELLKAGSDTPVLVQLAIEQTPHGELLNGLGALLQTAQLENPRLRGQVIGLDGERDLDAWLRRLHDDARAEAGVLRYRAGVRQRERGVELAAAQGSPPWKAGGVYLVTGGLGGLGRIFASEILRHAPDAHVVLAGRSEPGSAQRQQLSAWADARFDVEYRQADLSQRGDVDALLAHIDARHGRLDGVIHAAGVIRDGFLYNKTAGDYAAVFGAKVDAVDHLDAAIGERPLDLFVLFASTSGVYGNLGQADYAAANAFLDGHARHRTARVARGERHGRTLSVAWPLWADGSMQMPEAARLRLRESGLVELTAADGIAALYAALATDRARVHLHRVAAAAPRRPVVATPVVVAPVAVAPVVVAASADTAQRFDQQVLAYLKQALSSTLKLPVDSIEAEAPFERYGLDSILALELTNALERSFGSLSKTLFFEYQTLAALSRYFHTAHRERLLALIGSPAPVASAAAPVAAAAPVVAPARQERPQRGTRATVEAPRSVAAREQIAIIGVAGRYPGAATLDAFWDNLKNGRDAITEVPADRWNHDAYFDAQKGKADKTYGKWGGFIDGVADFDPLFFSIPPVEAYGLDPQERLFLQCAYATLEDAGYTREALARQTRRGREGSVGVFVGVMYEEYQLYGAQAQTLGHGLTLSGSPASIANRVSYFCNFHGPSLAVDTMCSSSLTAIHLACESLLRGQCEAALAGGVNVSVHPNKYLMLAQGRFLSSDGRCRSFGEGGDGYVPGEGVGAVLLKPLSHAIADDDRIYAVIRGSAVNHGGKTNGYAVPNPVAQADLVAQAFEDSGVDARSISYLESHGTGTSLGDPIEIRGLVGAFRTHTPDIGFCAIGSVKSNIGHCESAAGIAALTKVLLQLRHGQLVPSLHSDTLNPFIDFADTPFVVQRELREWRRPVATAGGAPRELPRRAGISSFGAGGSNAHLVIEEYRTASARAVEPAPRLVVLSAKSEEALQRQIGQLLAFAESAGEEDLADIAYTLQIGREAMEFRLALTVASLVELREKLRACADGDTDVPGCRRGEGKHNKELQAAFAADDDLQRAVASWLARGKLDQLLDFWVKGLRIDWSGLYAQVGSRPRRIALPTYPFERERYWIGLRELGLEPAVEKEPEVTVRESVLRTAWREAVSPASSAIDGVLIVADATTQAMAKALSSRWSRSRIVRSDAADWRGTADWADWEALVDVTGCGDAPAADLAWVEIVQAWVQARAAQGGRALCVTHGDGGALRAGLYRMLQSEYGRIRSRCVDVDIVDGDAWVAQAVHELGADDDAVEVRYRAGRRECAQLEEVTLSAATPSLAWSPEGVLWITGGTRGLGLASARHYVARHGVKRLVLTGRETLPDRAQWAARAAQTDATGLKLRALLALEADGVMLETTSVDLADAAALRHEMQRLTQALGPIHGVLHCAGLADGQTPAFVHKTPAGIAAVLAPKVAGLDTLLHCLREEAPSLRFCVLFSSISALAPDLASGQADYAMANAYMDAVARRTHDLPVASVQWGSWNESGMGEVKSRVYRELGLASHSDAQGMAWLDRIVAADARGVLAPLQVDASRFDAQRLLQRRRAPAVRAAAPVASAASATAPAGEGLQAQTERWLRELFAQQLRMPLDKVDVQTPLPDYGVDSVLLMQLLVPIGAQVNDTLDPSILYEHQTIAAFARWLVSKYEAVLRANLSQGQAIDDAIDAAPVEPVARTQAPRVAAVSVPAAPAPAAFIDEPLAIVGLSCRFAGANDASAYWDLLSQGRSAIAPVPASRWGTASTDDWAALLDDVDHFDPEYFHLALADARAMDRQALMVLEESLKAWHHAGYAAAELKGTRSGVYLGARGHYNADAAALREAINPILAMGQNYLAANISQFLDLRGPSLVVDTACSSALVALNMAAQSLRSGEIDAALVGGVSLLNGPGALRLFEQRGILQRGEFHIFDRRAQGAILGEGVGMVVLKRQSQALADGDRIYALVRAVAVNNDGRTAGPTAPNVHAQKDVMQRALDRSGRRAQDIGHIDVNGSGSEITDLLELRAIESVYRPDRTQPCELGSMKPNIGHPLCAEGIASLIKVVLMLHQGQRVPFLSAHEPMAHYDFAASPFRFTRALRTWDETPRVAAINSFADGGTNAHVIVEGAAAHDARRQPLAVPAFKRVRLPSVLAPDRRDDANDAGHTAEAGKRSLAAVRRVAIRRVEKPNGDAHAIDATPDDSRLAPVKSAPGFWERYA